MLHTTPSGTKAMSLEFRDIPVKFIGTKAIASSTDDERASVAEFLVERSRKKETREGLAKELLLTLSTKDGTLRANPKSGGQALNIPLAHISSMAVISLKFAFVVAEEGAAKGGKAYAFQFRKKGDAPGFLAALEKASLVEPTRDDVTSPRGRKISFSSTAMSSAERIRLQNRPSIGTSVMSGTEHHLEARLRSAEVTIADLQRRLSEEKSRASANEVQRLTTELEKTKALQETAEARSQVENLRKEMALAAADMSAELAQLKMDLTHESATAIMAELTRIQSGLAAMDAVHNPATPLWERVGDAPPTVQTSTPATERQGSKADVRLMALAQRASNTAIRLDGETGESSTDAFLNMEQGQLVSFAERQQQRIAQLEQDLATKDALIAQLEQAANRTATLQDQVDSLQNELVNERRQAELEKSLMADTIAALKQSDGNRTPERMQSSVHSLNLQTTASGSPLQQVASAHSSQQPSQRPLATTFEMEAEDLQPASRTGTNPTIVPTAAAAAADQDANNNNNNQSAIQPTDTQADEGDNDDNQLDGDESVAPEDDMFVLELALAKNGQRLGMSIAGGSDDRVQPDDSRIYITAILDEGAAVEDGRLGVGDVILAVDGHDVTNVTHAEAVGFLSQSGDPVMLTIGRFREELDATLTITFPKGPDGLGFSIAGGTDSPLEGNDTGIYITALIEGGSAARDGRLQVGDRILEVNSRRAIGINHEQAVALLQAVEDECCLVVARLPDDKDDVEEQELNIVLKKGPNGFGFSIAGGVDDPLDEYGDTHIYVTQLVPGGAAEADGQLAPADRLVSVNGVSMQDKTRSDAVAALKLNPEQATLVVAREVGGDDSVVEDEEILEIEFAKGDGGLGFSIAGGVDDVDNPDDAGVYVIQVIEGGSAQRDGRLRKGDKLLTVNGTNVENVTHERAVELLQSRPDAVHLTVSRLTDATLITQDFEDNVVELSFAKSKEYGLGFSIAGGTDDMIEPGDPGIYISDIIAEGPAFQDGRLQFGDELMEVNGQSLTGMTHAEAVDVLRGCDGMTTFKVARLPANDTSDEIVFDVELKREGQGLGFSIAGGVDDPVEEDDTAIYITNVLAEGAAHADGRLKLADKIIAVNGVALEGKSHDDTVKLLSAENTVKLTVSRLAEDNDKLQQ
eukprot:TRINITY_DN10597_c0_g1_i2.p1 TRINITY_DN10597_c0_g1~~TRINITY_DN10597_c0_g1_i2.p1  ORF type:complete len:1148 (+),score=404.54 TRINITY_DN10597_c0_g1_i2:642-4085(+)